MSSRINLDSLLKRVEKPGRYIGNEINQVAKDPERVSCNFCFAFPELYEIGMSYQGLQILYNIVNLKENIYCQRAFAPNVDMEKIMREENVPLFTLETKMPVKEWDIFGFTLQYEMTFTNILNMLDLAQIPVRKKDRTEKDPIIIAGGPCAYNPEPLCDFIDMFLIGDGEELLPKVLELYVSCDKDREKFFNEAAKLNGVYIPSFYDVEYNEDGTIKKLCKLNENAKDVIKRSFVEDIENIPYPEKPIIPMVEAVHDRACVETFRGCTRGCRFCQAGMIYRPVRERSKARILELVEKQIKNTGHDELSLLSLSTSDYSQFESMIYDVIDYTKSQNVAVSLPSLRIDKFAFNVLYRIQEFKKTSLTYAVEAGTQRLRDVINKGVREEDVLTSISEALKLGWGHIKLYFVIGLPTETFEDLDGIVDIAKKITDINYEINGRKGGRFNLNISVSIFVPKADTPFQWYPQDTNEVIREKQRYLREKLKMKNVVFSYHNNSTSSLEAVFARGDRRVGALIYRAFELGCKLDGWTEHFKEDAWNQAFIDTGISKEFYANRTRSYDEILPWSHIDCCVSKQYFLSEAEKASRAVTTKDCRYGCNDCGINNEIYCPLGGIYNE
ncbi:MAG: TIGR03960 family B12-binding radical SAM protein [Clostridia bacterium]|nr:TIGR03960 family B12-binding radical SAM protein [Clostridia bacterium]